MTRNVQLLTEHLYAVVQGVFPQGGPDQAVVKLRDGGVLITSSDGDHVHVLVQSTHFVPGEELPF